MLPNAVLEVMNNVGMILVGVSLVSAFVLISVIKEEK